MHAELGGDHRARLAAAQEYDCTAGITIIRIIGPCRRRQEILAVQVCEV